jgi:hypothetical protein
MKNFLIKISLFSLLLLSVVIIGFVLPVTPRASKSLLYAKVKKDNLLKKTNNPRIIFVGGSNLSFGINSKVIKDSLKLNPINTAIHASIGLEYMMDNTLQYIKKNDIVILAPEYSHFYGRFVYGGEELLRTVADIELSQIFELKKEQLKNISKYILKYSFSKLKPTEYYGYEESDVYSVNSFNQYGDVYTHWKMQQQKFPSSDTIRTNYNSNTIKLINDFKIELEKKEANLFITYPSYQASSFDKSIKQIKKIETELINNNFELLGTPERYRIPDSMMFNTSYHLLKTGVDYRTELLIEDIKQVRTHNNVYKK